MERIADILGISGEEYERMVEQFRVELMRMYKEGIGRNDAVYVADKLLKWFDEGDETERIVKAILLVKREEELQNLREAMREIAEYVSGIGAVMAVILERFGWVFVEGQRVW